MMLIDEQKKAAEEEAKAKAEAAAAEKERKKQEAAKAKAEARAKMQSTPSFQIQKWLNGMSGLMWECDENVGKAKGSDKIPNVLTQQYILQFGQSKDNLKSLRDKLEAANPEAADTAQLLSESNIMVTKLQEDFKAFALLHKGYHPPRAKAKAKTTATPSLGASSSATSMASSPFVHTVIEKSSAKKGR